MTTTAESRGTPEKVELLLRIYRQMVAIREFETQVNERQQETSGCERLPSA
jgi:TPP-dependent pyruvate/acetoin dehydrogenase alpha subunit